MSLALMEIDPENGKVLKRDFKKEIGVSAQDTESCMKNCHK